MRSAHRAAIATLAAATPLILASGWDGGEDAGGLRRGDAGRLTG